MKSIPDSVGEILSLYLNLGHYDLYLMKADIDKMTVLARDELRSGLELVILEKLMTASAYEKLTEDELETDEAAQRRVEKIYSYLFDDGPWPDAEQISTCLP